MRQAIQISDYESLSTARELLRKEGILAGSSSGTLVAAALQCCRQQTEPKRVVTFVCDSGNKYLSKMYNDFWMIDHGFSRIADTGDLRDLIVRKFAHGGVVSVAPTELLSAAYARMRLYDVSQLPVLDGSSVVGIVDESDLLLAAVSNVEAFGRPVSEIMTSKLETIPRTASLERLLAIFDSGRVAIIVDDAGFHGLITRVDVLNYLRRKERAA